MLQRLMRTSDDKAAFFARLALGIAIFPHGAQKLLGWFGGNGFSATMDFFTSNMGLPWIVAFLVIVGELFGSLGLIVGFLGRVAAAGIGVIMLGAVLTVHADYGFFMNWYGNKQGEGFEYHILALGLVLAVMIAGSGAWSVDRMMSRRS